MSKLPERVYYALAAIGLVLTWSFNIQFFAGGGSIAPGSFLPSAFANPLTTSITLDVYWAALVFSVWVVASKGEPFAPPPWLYIVLCFAVALAFAFPLYLGRRQQLRRMTLEGPAT
jgi:hypothetical protein